MASLTPSPFMQFFDANGTPLVGGKLYTYASGTTSPLSTYTNAGALTPNTNPVILDSSGSAAVWLGPQLYTFLLTDANGVQLWSADDIGTHITLQNVTYNGSETTDNIKAGVGISGSFGINLGVFSATPSITTADANIAIANATSAVGLKGATFIPTVDDAISLGATSYRWSYVYGTKGIFGDGNTSNVYIGTYSSTPSVTTTGTSLALSNASSAVALQNATFIPTTDNTVSSGTASYRWSFVYGTKGIFGDGGTSSAYIGTYGGAPAVTTTGTSIGLANSSSAVALQNATLIPTTDNTVSLGTASYRWASLAAKQISPGAGTAIWTSSSGSPEGVLTAPVGSLYTRTDGGAGSTLYVKESGSGNTGWVAK